MTIIPSIITFFIVKNDRERNKYFIKSQPTFFKEMGIKYKGTKLVDYTSITEGWYSKSEIIEMKNKGIMFYKQSLPGNVFIVFDVENL